LKSILNSPFLLPHTGAQKNKRTREQENTRDKTITKGLLRHLHSSSWSSSVIIIIIKKHQKQRPTQTTN
jgi:hypothetical protein